MPQSPIAKGVTRQGASGRGNLQLATSQRKLPNAKRQSAWALFYAAVLLLKRPLSSNCSPMPSSHSSRPLGAVKWMPSGSPLAAMWVGRLMAGWPVRLACWVKGVSARLGSNISQMTCNWRGLSSAVIVSICAMLSSVCSWALIKGAVWAVAGVRYRSNCWLKLAICSAATSHAARLME